MLGLLFQIDLGSYSGIIGFAGLLAGILSTWIFLRSGLLQQQAGGFKGLLEIEEKRTKKLEEDNKRLAERNAYLETENLNLSRDWTSLSELHSKKSIILEAITGEYRHASRLIETGRIAEALERYAPGLMRDESFIEKPKGQN